MKKYALPKLYAAVLFMMAMVAAACDTGTTTGPGDHAAVTRTNMQPDSTAGWLYYSLEGDSVVPPSKAATAEWDIRMAYLLCCGNTQQIDVFLNSGTAGPGMVKGAIVESRFENLRTVPASSTLRIDDTSRVDRIIPVSLTNGVRLFSYNASTHTISVNPDRVLVVMREDGATFKFQFTSIYKDAPSDPTWLTPLGFYHFRYQKAKNGGW
jgi:hypothetical protein